jgi:hypothetical protein
MNILYKYIYFKLPFFLQFEVYNKYCSLRNINKNSLSRSRLSEMFAELDLDQTTLDLMAHALRYVLIDNQNKFSEAIKDEFTSYLFLSDVNSEIKVHKQRTFK